MKIIEVQPKDIYATVEFSIKQLRSLQMFLERAEVKYASKEEPEMVEVVEYIMDKLYPDLVGFLDAMEKEYGA